MSALATPATIVPVGVTPTGERLVREIPGVGKLVFENYGPGEWMTQKGEPAKVARRRYLLDDVKLDAVSDITATLSKEALMRWIEDQATRGAVIAERMGELAGVEEDNLLYVIRELGLGASAARDEGSDRGKAVHLGMHTLATEGRAPDPATHPERWRPWIQGSVRAWLYMQPEVVSSEEIVPHAKYGYAGRPDLLAIVDGKLTLIDYKTGKGRVYDSAHYQTRLYAMALMHSLGIEVEAIIIVGIDDDGGFQIVHCEASEDDAVALLDTFRSRKRINAGMATQRKLAAVA